MLNTDQEYKDQIKQVGKYNLKDTYKWKERAIFFQEKGYYTEAIEDTHDWNTFWDEEKEKIMNGVWIDGFYIPGLYYFYLNYLPIYHKQLNKYEFPDVYDMDYHTFLCLEHAIFLKKHFVVIKKRAAGYEQPYSEPVLTVDGWKTMGDLKIGDYVQTPTGIPAKILEIFEQGEKDVYEITLRDGRKVRCGLDHLWKVNEKTRKNKSVIVPLKEMIEKGIYLKSKIKCKKKNYNIYRYTIDEIDPIPFNKKELKIHPYIIGALIGDGSFSKSQVRITSADPEIHERIIKLLGDDYFYGSDKDQCTKNKKCIRFSIRYKKRFQELEKDFKNAKYGVNPLIRSIQDYGLIDKNTYTKFIPDDYLHSSIEDRLELLKGLMDTDGSIRESGNGAIYFTVNKILSEQVAYLVRSLGMTASISEFKGRCVNCKNFYRVKITPNKFEIFHLKRKLDRLNLNKKRFTSVAITEIKKLDYKENSRCIYIDSEDHMYLTKDFIQTHNTLKFCVPLIRELWFSRGSPNYIATFEEAQVLKTWADVIEPYREHLNTHTDWYREFSPSKPLNWRVAKSMTSDTGRNITVGRLNTLKGLILSKSPSKGVGGCNLKGTPIKMSNGTFKNVEDIKIGDFVVGKDGLPKKVLNLFSGVSEMFEIFQTKGKSYIVTPNHKLHLYDQKNNDCINIEVQDFVKLSNNRQKQLNGIKHKGIVYSNNDRNLPIDPYYLGLFLGDGCQGKYNILVNKTKDPEIFEYIKNLAIKENHDFSCIHRNLIRKEYNDQMYDLKLNSKTRKEGYTYNFEKLGFKRKFIPLEYKQSSIRQRLELLAGLIDSDGYYNHKKARFEISSKYDELFNDIVELCTDLGFTISKSIKINNGKKSTVYNKETIINAIYIKGELWKIPTKVNRKIAPNAKRRNSDGKSKLKVTNWGIGEYYGFECEDHLYILEDGTVTHNSATFIFADECFGEGTPVIMSDKTIKKIENIKVGDYVLGIDGTPKKVINTFTGKDNLYDIQQRKGLSYTVNSKHKLVVEKRNHRYDNGIKFLTPEEYLKLDKYSLRTHYGIKNKLIEYSKKDLAVDPYFLGLWLGDGTKGHCEVIVNKEKDLEIFEWLKQYTKSVGYSFVEKQGTAPTCKMFRIKSNNKHNFITKKLKELGVFYDKNIPNLYLESSKEQRLELLAGLMDSDGYLAKGTNSYSFSYEIACAKPNLMQSIVLLARSLGFYVKTEIKAAKKTKTKSGHVINTKSYTRICIRGDIHQIPVRIKRKNPPLDYKKVKEGNHLITSFKIKPKGIGDYYGIEIEGEDKLFLLEDFTVVHNCGVNPVLSKFIGYVKPMITYGDISTGTIIVSGAVGELKHLEGGLKEYIQYPEKNSFYAVDNIWDKDNEFSGKKCGFFVPESWAYFGVDRDPTSEFYNQPFIDEHGNSFVERAEEYIKKKRAGLIDEGEEADKFDISQKPLTLAECFQYRGDNVFPTDLINPQIEKVEKNEDHGTFIDLYRTQDKVVKHKLLSKYDHKPILEHPIDPKRKDKDGVIQVWEFPPSNRQTYGVYWAGVDIVRDSESVNSPSLNVIHIYKGSHNLSEEYTEDRIVAKYMSRPKDKMEWFQKALLLLEWYNAEALVENNVNWFIEESIKEKQQFRLAKAPQWSKDLTPQGTAHLTKPYGVVMTPKLHEKIIDAISAYIKEPIFTSYDENTGEPTVHYGIERIRDLQLLRELVNYRPKKEYEKGNYDAICSFGLALLHAKNNEVLGVIPEDTKENVNFNQKNAKLMLRSRFSHTNLKKLSNANNI